MSDEILAVHHERPSPGQVDALHLEVGVDTEEGFGGLLLLAAVGPRHVEP